MAYLNEPFQDFLREEQGYSDPVKMTSLRDAHAEYFNLNDLSSEREFNDEQRLIAMGTDFRDLSHNMADFLRESLQEAGALRARNRVGNKEQRRIRDLNHKASRRLVDWAQQFKNPVLKIEDLDGIRDGSDWRGVHTWHFHQLQEFIVYKAEQAGIRVQKVDPFETSQRCSACGAKGTRDGGHFSCPECDRGRHADLNAAENIRQREGEPCTA